MAQDSELWHELEDKLKSFTSSFQSLPSHMKEKALELFAKQMAANDSSRLHVQGQSISEKPLDSAEDKDKDKELPSKSGATVPKKRRKLYQNSSGYANESSTEPPPTVESTQPPKKRGRPAQDLENIKENESLIQKKRDRAARNSVASELLTSSADSQQSEAAVVKNSAPTESVPQATRISSRLQGRKRLSFGRYANSSTKKCTGENNDPCNLKMNSSVILVPVDESHLSAAMRAGSDATSECDPTDDQNTSEVERKSNEDSEAKKPMKRSGFYSQVKCEVVELTTDTDSVGGLDVPRRKRGRPSKKDLLARAKSETWMSTKNQEKKPIGRPRFSTYPSGYVPKPKPFSCTHCGKQLASRSSLREHVRRHTGDLFMCDLCGQKFSTNSGFLLHKKYHADDPEVFKCTYCRYTVSSKKLLDEHYMARHDPNRPRQHTCYVCGKGFHAAVQLEKHLVCHSESKPYVCDECDFATAYPGGLEKHKYNVHETEHRRLYECELCHVKLRSRGTYNEHLGRHFNQRKKKCEICQKTFPTASQLASHRRSHSDPKIPCEVCGKLLRNKHKMKIHMYLHTGQKDFACPYCTYVTYVKHNLKKHCSARHKVEYPPVEHPRMKKYQAGDAQVVAASLTDPLAVRCVQKMSIGSTLASTTSDKPASTSKTHSSQGESDDSSASEVVAPKNAADNENESTVNPSTADVEINMSKTVVDVPREERAAEIVPVAGHSSIVSNVVPIIRLPLFSALGIPTDLIATQIGTTASTVDDRKYLTLTTATVGDQQTLVLAPAFSSL